MRGGKGRRTGRQDPRRQKKKIYEAARLQDSEEEYAATVSVLEDAHANSSRFEPQDDNEDVQVDDANLDDLSSEDDEAPAKKQDAYAALLQSFGQTAQAEEPQRKKRKLNGTTQGKNNGLATTSDAKTESQGDQTLAEDLQETGMEDDDEESADEDEDPADAFDLHFANPDDNVLSRRLKEVAEKQWHTQNFVRDGGKWTVSKPGVVTANDENVAHTFPEPSSFKIKQRLSEKGKATLNHLAGAEKSFASTTLSYRDALFGARTVPNSSSLRSITCLHALNHITKTRDRVLKNNAKLAKVGPDTDQEFRDQGFTRPKVLILLPTRQSCVKYINTIVGLYQPEQQENKKRFEDSYVADEEMAMDRPEDYRELFAGNNDDMFRIGVKFTRKTMKFFSQFYNSDLILASPLGLRQAISGKKADADFLSSIEVLVLDQADALAMQNWEHVQYVLEQLNQQPKEAHGCDFSRVRMWYLEGQAKYFRQTIMLSAHLAPQHLALFAAHAQNTAGRAIFSPTYPGAIAHPQSLGIKQTFLRFPSPSLPNDPTARFNHFTSALLPSITKTPRNPDGSGLGLLIYIPDSLDFPRLRNHFSFHPSCANLSFAAIDENHEPASKTVRRARSHFESGRHGVVLYTERAHHFFRYKLKGVKRVICYGVPTKPVFWEEIVAGYLEDGGASGADVRCLFSKWERVALERVVGSERVGKMVKERGGGDVFEFV
jgi:U3 small nucleolar RNA-associated protein 25